MPDHERDELTRKRQPTREMWTPTQIGGERQSGDGAFSDLQSQIGRAALIVLSAGGVVVCLSLWITGHGLLALRVLAGDVILATTLLLVM